MPKELEEQLMELEWPPVVEFPTEKEGETRPVTLTELDVNWILCTVLGMKWSDATGVEDNLHRRFLYNKAMEIASSQAGRLDDFEKQKEELETKIDGQLKDIHQSLSPPRGPSI